MTESPYTTGVNPPECGRIGGEKAAARLASDGCYAPDESGIRTTDDTPNRQTSVYRYFDKNDLLLYVGITSRGARRNFEHASYKDWWDFVARQEVTHHPSRAEALDVERRIIQEFRPPFNTQHNPDHEVTRALYLAYASAPGGGETAEQVYRRIGRQLPLDFVGQGDDAHTLVFRSRVEHMALIAKTRVAHPQPVIYARGRHGHVKASAHLGPVMTFHVSSRKFPFAVKSAWLNLKRVNPAKTEWYLVTQISVTQLHDTDQDVES